MWFHGGVAEHMEVVPDRRRAVALFVVITVLVAAALAIVIVHDDPVPTAAAPASTTTTTTDPPRTTTTSGPQPVVPVSTPLASPNGEVPTYDAPDGKEIGKVGIWYGYPMTMPIVEEQGDWLRIQLPERPNEATAWVRAADVTRSASPWRMVLSLSETRVRVYKDGFEMWSAPVGIGRDHTRTPTGSYFVAVIETPGPVGYGPIVLDLNAHSEDIQSWQGSGDAITAFHGPFGSEELIRSGGGKVSNGCLRMLPEDQIKMEGITLGTPVDIIA